jgi:hypothetical protein
MEFGAKVLEQRSNFVEDLTLLDFARDTAEILSVLQQNEALQPIPK